MDRQIVYPGQIPLETDLLKTNQNTMIAIAKLASAMFGSSTIVNGLTVTAQSPAAMAVNVSAGEIYELANLEATAYSSLTADTTHSIMKQGVSLNTQALTITAPGTVGYSINYLIQATYQDSDSNAATLPYYNSSNPSQAWSGPNNSGTQQYTTRSGAVVVSAKAGVAATTGSQSTPSPDSGYVGLYVVTVDYGASTITSGNISRYSGAPLLPSGLLQSIQNGNTSFATDTGVANAYVCNFTPAITTRAEGQLLRFKVKTTNTGTSTLNDGVGVVPLVGGAHAALQGGEMVAGGDALAQWNSTVGTGSYVLLFCTGAPEQVANGTQSQHAIALGQFSTLAISTGLIKSVKRQVFSASATYTPSPGMVYCDVEVVGGGGGGGGATGGSGTSSAGGGGGGGGYAKKAFTAVQIGASQTVTIGAGGVGVSGNSTGGTGGTTTFGALLTAVGGSGGTGSLASTVAGIPAAGGAGGTASGGDINVKGGNGFASFLLGGASGGLSGQGGNAIYGAGGYPSGPVGSGSAGSGYGGGASGGASNTASAATGATGASGLVIVTEYCTQ